MDELKTKEGELTTADLASHGIAQEQPKGPKLVKGQEPEALDRAQRPSQRVDEQSAVSGAGNGWPAP